MKVVHIITGLSSAIGYLKKFPSGAVLATTLFGLVAAEAPVDTTVHHPKRQLVIPSDSTPEATAITGIGPDQNYDWYSNATRSYKQIREELVTWQLSLIYTTPRARHRYDQYQGWRPQGHFSTDDGAVGAVHARDSVPITTERVCHKTGQNEHFKGSDTLVQLWTDGEASKDNFSFYSDIWCKDQIQTFHISDAAGLAIWKTKEQIGSFSMVE